jgi:hypothetical protein
MLVFSSAAPVAGPTNEQVFRPIHAAIVLEIASNWNEVALQQAITAAVAPQLTIAQEGLAWKPHRNAEANWYEMDGQQHLALAVQGKICILASDQATLLELLTAKNNAQLPPSMASIIAGFDHSSEREPFVHLTGLLDQSGGSSQPAGNNAPHFFSGNIASLSNTFQDLKTERFTESWTADHIAHQTVLYEWRH